MSKKKAQHFVPRFYLKYFSFEANQTHIGIYNKTNEKFIPKGDLKHQAYINDYYDDDGEMEDILSYFEGKAASVLKIFLEHKALPPPNESAENILRIFTLISAFRTKSMGDDFNDNATKFFHEVYIDHEKLKDRAKGLRVEVKFPTTFYLDKIIERLDIINDLKLKAIVNLTETPFITSDNPVVFYNQFMEKRNVPLGITALGIKGLQIFYPIHPRVCFLFYDDSVYKTVKNHSNLIGIENKNDIEQINFLQYLNSDQNIYFDETFFPSDVKQLVQLSLNFKKEERSFLKEIAKTTDKNGKGSKRLLLHSQNSLRVNLFLTFIQELEQLEKTDELYRPHFLKIMHQKG